MIRKIHTIKTAMGMADEVYRDHLACYLSPDRQVEMMQGHGEVSSKLMDDSELAAACQGFAALQGQGQRGRGKGGRYSPASRHKRRKTPADKVRALWISLGKAGVVNGREDALQGWLDRMFGREGVAWAREDILRCLDAEQLETAIEALKKMGERG